MKEFAGTSVILLIIRVTLIALYSWAPLPPHGLLPWLHRMTETPHPRVEEVFLGSVLEWGSPCWNLLAASGVHCTIMLLFIILSLAEQNLGDNRVSIWSYISGSFISPQPMLMVVDMEAGQILAQSVDRIEGGRRKVQIRWWNWQASWVGFVSQDSEPR